jgi:2-dehydropantoate 2-reductase
MRFIVYGAGAVGSTIGGHLYRTGDCDVVLVGNPDHVDRIRESGLRLITADEEFVLKVPACKLASELAPFRDDDVILLTAKSQHTLRCLGQLKNAGAPRTLPIFCCQNGLVNEPLATRVFDRVYGVMMVISVIFLEPGMVINSKTGRTAGFLEVGCYPRGLDDLARAVSTAFCEAGFDGGVNCWVMKAKGAKALSNLINAVEAITDKADGSSEFIGKAREEAVRIWSAAGIEWEPYEEFLKRVNENGAVYRMPKGYEWLGSRWSSWQSLFRGTGNIEAEELNGDVVKLGRLLNLPAPYNEVLWRVAMEMAEKKEKPGKYTVQQLEEMVRKLASS